jgi:hypothetical protein
MAVDREALKKQMEKQKARSAGGKIRFLNKSGTTTLRLVGFKDEDGNEQFAREHHSWGRKGGQGQPITNRAMMFDKTDLIAKVLEKEADAPFKARVTYICNGVDISQTKQEMKRWQLPATVWASIAEYLMDEDFENLLDPKLGVAVKIKRSGSGLETEYSVVVSPKPVPVSKELMKGVIDPLDDVDDPGIAGQAAAAGLDASDYFDEDELEELNTEKPKKKSKAKPAADDEDEEDAPPPKKKAKPPVEDEDEDEDEEEAPPPKKKKKPAPPVEDDDEDEEDEDEEEKPVKKKKPVAKDDDEDASDDEDDFFDKIVSKGKKK